jgi:hypothetical protein
MNKELSTGTNTYGESDYAALPATIKKTKANLDTGHGGTYTTKNGGKFGQAVTAFLEWQSVTMRMRRLNVLMLRP